MIEKKISRRLLYKDYIPKEDVRFVACAKNAGARVIGKSWASKRAKVVK